MPVGVEVALRAVVVRGQRHEQAWRTALTAPQGPVWVEITQDTLLEPAVIPPVAGAAAEPLTARLGPAPMVGSR